MALARGFCWFAISLLLSSVAAIACFGIYFHFGGPPPHETIDVGLKILSIWSVISIFVSLMCVIALSTRTKSICLLLVCELGLLTSCVGSFFIRYFLHEVTLDPEGMTAYTQRFFRENGSPPPFLDRIQREMQCCGINGINDYLWTGNSHDSLEIPSSCCNLSHEDSHLCLPNDNTSTNKSVVDIDSFQYSSTGCKIFLSSSVNFLTSMPAGSRTWLRILLYCNNLKDFYLDFMVLYTFILFLVFNYHLIRFCIRRPEVVPRAPPLEIDRNSHRPRSLIPTTAVTTVDGDLNMNVAKLESSPSPYLFPRGRVMTEFGTHPFMLSAIGNRIQPKHVNPGQVHDSIIPGPCERCLRFSNTYTHSTVPEPVPSAPPPPYYSIVENQM